MATALYMRVSTEKQEETGVSLQTQKERLHAYCTLKGLTDVKEYLDVGSGRTTENRINYNRMMGDVKEGFINNIVIMKLDRLTRSIVDLNALVTKLNEKDCALHSCTENIDTTTASGRMMMNLIGTFAQWESETISERVKVNMQTLAEKGIWQSAAPYGFYLGKDKKLKVDEKQKDILLEALEMVASGSSFSFAEQTIIDKYNVKWHKGFLIKKLESPSTVGDMYRNGVTVHDTHEALISRSYNDKLLTIARERGNPRTQIFEGDLFRRKIICPQCDKVMSLRANKSEKDKRNLYSYCCHACYREGNGMLSVSEKVLEFAFSNYIDRLKIDFKEADLLVNEAEKELKKLQFELKNHEAEKKRIQRAWIKGFINEEDLIEHQKEIDKNVIETESKLKKLNINVNSISEKDMLELQATLKDSFEILSKDEKILFIQNHIKKITIKRKLLKGYKKKYSVTIDTVMFY